MAKRLGLAAGRPLDNQAVARACFALDPVSLIHGVFFARKNWPWQPRIARAVTGFIEAYDVRPAVSGGVKRDLRYQRGQGAARPPRATAWCRTPAWSTRPGGSPPTSRSTTPSSDSYGLSEPATALLEALADYEIGTLLDRGLRLRTACDLRVTEVRGERPDAQEAAARVAKLAAECADELGPVTDGHLVRQDQGTGRVRCQRRSRSGSRSAATTRRHWDRSVNEGTAEWPPSPWRLLRALTATWHTRWPDLPAETFDRLLAALGDPPSYRTPPVRPGHTRHYLPDLDHRKGEAGHTDLTLDPFLSLRHSDLRDTAMGDAELLVRWDAELDTEQRAVLAKLAELLPYLGRADSVCEARLLDEDPAPDKTWWCPGAEGARAARLLAPALPVRREALEVTTVQVRKMRRTQPPGTIWVSYAATESEAPRRAASRLPPRWMRCGSR